VGASRQACGNTAVAHLDHGLVGGARRHLHPAAEVVDNAFTGLLLGLGAVALLVVGVGIANVMVISVLERRSDIGLRWARPAATAYAVLAESLLLSGIGGVGGALLGAAVVAVYAASGGWPVVVPPVSWVGAVRRTRVPAARGLRRPGS
jgi:putative ABC transport system permease protein